jgi:hypothetical protein
MVPDIVALLWLLEAISGDDHSKLGRENAPAPQVPRFSCLFLINVLRTKKRMTARTAIRRIATIAPMAPPEIPLDDAPLALAALFPADGVTADGVTAEAGVETETVVDPVLLGNTIGVGVVEGMDNDDDEEEEDEDDDDANSGEDVLMEVEVGVVIGKVEVVEVVGVSGRNAGSVEGFPEPIIFKNGEI